MASRRRVLSGRKLLLASVGIATVSYVGCSTMETSGNLVAPPSTSATSGGGQGGAGGTGGESQGGGGAGGESQGGGGSGGK